MEEGWSQGPVSEEKSGPAGDTESLKPVASEATSEPDSSCPEQPENLQHNEPPKASEGASVVTIRPSVDAVMAEADISEQINLVKQGLIERTADYGIPRFEKLYTRVLKGVFAVMNKEMGEDHRSSVLRYLAKFVEDAENF